MEKLKQEKTDLISKINSKIKKVNSSNILLMEENERLKYNNELNVRLSNQIIELEKINNPQKNKHNNFMVDDIPYNSKHPYWNPEYGKILFDFQSCLHDKRKITNLIKKCGWNLKNSTNHNVYTRTTSRGYEQILVIPSTPSSQDSWKKVWCNLKQLEIERILS